MRAIGNIIWVVFVGLWLSLSCIFVGLIWCISIVGIPVGVQCFKLAQLSLAPFGRDVYPGGGAGSAIMNTLWLLFGGLEIAALAAVCGIILCITIVGIPFGKQCFKISSLALTPFGAEID